MMENNIKALVLSREAILTMVFVGAAVVAPLLHSQLVTGAIVNAALFAAIELSKRPLNYADKFPPIVVG